MNSLASLDTLSNLYRKDMAHQRIKSAALKIQHHHRVHKRAVAGSAVNMQKLGIMKVRTIVPCVSNLITESKKIEFFFEESVTILMLVGPTVLSGSVKACSCPGKAG